MSDTIEKVQNKGNVPILIEDEMKKSYLDYAMSVIVSRALPDVRDGMKPVHRRILYSMYENGYEHNKPYRKSARIVGDVIGKYHPHGGQAVYDALVRMAQEFSMGMMLIDGQGNFGSIDGDPAAAMRYTEVRLTKSAGFLLDDLDKETVLFQPNYDNQEKEPTVVPAKFPNLLVNGAGGIAVGMATNIPPHNLGEVLDGTLALLDNPELTALELMNYIPGPDFPTGGMIIGHAGARAAYHTGRGSVVNRGCAEIEVNGNKTAIIITAVPYQCNKAGLVEKIADLVREKRIEGISDLRDESDRQGVRVVVELKRDAVADVILNQLYRYTPLQSNFSVNMLALNHGKPEQMGLKQILHAFLGFREEVVIKRVRYILRKARDRAHVLVGLAVAVSNLDRVVAMIKAAPDPQTAKQNLIDTVWDASAMADYIRLIDDPRHPLGDDGTYRLSERQAQAILDLRLHRLTGLGRDELANELSKLAENIADYLDILGSRERIIDIIRTELKEIKEQFAIPRRTQIVEAEGELEEEDFIKSEDMAVLVTANGYIMRVPADTYRAQKRGGKGRSGMTTRDEDYIVKVFVANTHDPVLFFSNTGMVYRMKVWRLPLGTPQSKGKAMVNLFPLAADEAITTVLPVTVQREEYENFYILFATTKGQIRKSELSDFTFISVKGKIAFGLEENERLVSVKICEDKQDCLLTTRLGRAIRLSIDKLRVVKSRSSNGVIGVDLTGEDTVISMSILNSFKFTPDEAAAYMRKANALRRSQNAEQVESVEDDADDEETAVAAYDLPDDRFAEMQAAEQFIMTITENGFGKRTSAYAYRVTGRGGMGVATINLGRKKGTGVVAGYVAQGDEDVVCVTDKGQIIRFPVSQVSIIGRTGSGVTLFRTAEDEKIVSVALVEGQAETEDESAE